MRSAHSLGYLSAVFILAIVFLATLPRARADDDSACDFDPNIAITVTPVFDEPAIDNSKSLAEIQELSRSSTHVVPHYDNVTLGITHYEPVIEFRAPILERTMPDGSFCAHVEHIDALVGYRNITIYIARELTADSCSAQHVMTHEQRHVAVNRALLKEYTPLIEERLYSYFRLYGRIIGPDAGFAQTMVREKASAILNEMTQKMLGENQRRQRLVDSPEEYARNNVACNGRINDFVRRFSVSQR